MKDLAWPEEWKIWPGLENERRSSLAWRLTEDLAWRMKEDLAWPGE
jgi:hypothetical protein